MYNFAIVKKIILISDGIKAMSLTVDDIMQLERSTRYKEEDIRKWFRSETLNQRVILLPSAYFSIFKTECPNCQMSREQVVTLYSSVMPLENAERFVDQLFRTFDQDNNGHIDFHVHLSPSSSMSP